MSSPKIQFYASDLAQDLENRVGGMCPSPSAVAKRDLERYYYLLKLALPTFSEGEALLLCDVLNGSIIQPYSASLLWAEVSDALDEGYAQKWDIDGPALVSRLKGLTPFECLAVEDAIEQAWNNPTYRVEHMEKRVRHVGLVREK